MMAIVEYKYKYQDSHHPPTHTHTHTHIHTNNEKKMTTKQLDYRYTSYRATYIWLMPKLFIFFVGFFSNLSLSPYVYINSNDRMFLIIFLLNFNQSKSMKWPGHKNEWIMINSHNEQRIYVYTKYVLLIEKTLKWKFHMFK